MESKDHKEAQLNNPDNKNQHTKTEPEPEGGPPHPHTQPQKPPAEDPAAKKQAPDKTPPSPEPPEHDPLDDYDYYGDDYCPYDDNDSDIYDLMYECNHGEWGN
ncbi:putative 12 kDa protein [Babaco nucleorhabdovirus 1]|nr:putative 12 kDa protein [Babaco nucleorhabdovirus 1]